MKQNEEMSYKEIMKLIGVGAAFGMAFLMFVCCTDALLRLITGQ